MNLALGPHDDGLPIVNTKSAGANVDALKQSDARAQACSFDAKITNNRRFCNKDYEIVEITEAHYLCHLHASEYLRLAQTHRSGQSFTRPGSTFARVFLIRMHPIAKK